MQAKVIASGRLAVGDVPGLKSVPMATGTPASMKARAGAWWSFIRNQVVTGRRVATTARSSSAAAAMAAIPAGDGVARWSADAAPSSAASSAPPDGASSSAWRRGCEPSAGGRLEDPARLVGGEDTGLAEDVGEAGPAVGGDPRELFVEERRGRTPRCRRAGYRNSGGTACAPSHVGTTSTGPSRAEPVGDLEQPQLGLEVEAVAGLRLDRRHAVAEHLVQPAPAVGQQLRLGRRARRLDRRQDAATGGQDVEVGGAALAQLELVLARAREQQVGVRIDEAGRDRAARGVEPREAAEGVAVGARARPRPHGAGRRRGCGPPRPRRPGRWDRPGRSARRRPTSPCAAPRRTPALEGDDLGCSDDRRPGVGSPVRPPSMTRNGPPTRQPAVRCAGGGLEPQLQGLHRREVAQLEVGRRRRQPSLDRVLGRRAGAVGDGQEGGQRGEADELRFGQGDAILGGELADRCPRPATTG